MIAFLSAHSTFTICIVGYGSFILGFMIAVFLIHSVEQSPRESSKDDVLTPGMSQRVIDEVLKKHKRL